MGVLVAKIYTRLPRACGGYGGPVEPTMIFYPAGDTRRIRPAPASAREAGSPKTGGTRSAPSRGVSSSGTVQNGSRT